MSYQSSTAGYTGERTSGDQRCLLPQVILLQLCELHHPDAMDSGDRISWRQVPEWLSLNTAFKADTGPNGAPFINLLQCIRSMSTKSPHHSEIFTGQPEMSLLPWGKTLECQPQTRNNYYFPRSSSPRPATHQQTPSLFFSSPPRNCRPISDFACLNIYPHDTLGSGDCSIFVFIHPGYKPMPPLLYATPKKPQSSPKLVSSDARTRDSFPGSYKSGHRRWPWLLLAGSTA